MGTNGDYEIKLTQFEFPHDTDELDDNKADFRLQVDLRYRDERKGFLPKTVIMPGVDLYWECSKKDNTVDAKYKPERELVRKESNDNGNNLKKTEVDLTKVGAWGKMFRVQAAGLYEMRVTVFDVDHRGWWDKIAGAVKNVFGSVVRFVVPGGNAVLDSVVEESTTSVGRMMVNDENRVLFVGSCSFERDGTGGSWTIPPDPAQSDPPAQANPGFKIRFSATLLQGQ